MKKWIIRCLILIIPTYALVILVNFFADPANIYHASMTDDIVNGLKEHVAVEIAGDFDEGVLLDKRIAACDVHDVGIMGSSHVLYVDWDFDDYLNIGMSGEFLDDYYATVGLIDKYDKYPDTLVIGVDPYIFMDGLSIRQESLKDDLEYADKLIKGGSSKKGPIDLSGLKKVKELFSFSYFQSSVSAMINGVNATYVNPVDDIGCGDYPKILYTGRRVPSITSQKEIQDMDSAAQWDISAGAVYCMTDYEELSPVCIERFEILIDYILSKGTEVIIYLPAWYPDYYDEFTKNDKFSGVIKAEEYIRKMAKERGIEVRGSYNPYVCGLNKEDYLDHFHLKPEGGLKNYNVIIK